MWMPNGTLAEYITRGETVLSLSKRIQFVSTRNPGNIIIFSDYVTDSRNGRRARVLCVSVNLAYCQLYDMLLQYIQCPLFMGISTLWVVLLDWLPDFYIFVGQYYDRQ